jgi:hypothetical protein
MLVGLMVLPGCQAGQSRRAAVAAAEPGLNGTGDPAPSVVEVAPARPPTFADRHPLFTKPREYYDSSGNNKVVKAAAATMIGIPAGIVGELRQIVSGRQPTETY